MNNSYEKFNVTIKELLSELADIFNNLHKEGLAEEDGSFMEVFALLLQQWKGEELIQSFCESHEIWQDCHIRDVQFLLRDFSGIFEIDMNKLQIPAKIFIQTEGKSSAITNEDIEIIFDYLVALSKHACHYVEAKRVIQADYLPNFPLDNYKKNFGL